jgi:hypothetical protein
MTFHSVGNVIIPTGPKSMIFQRGGEKAPTRFASTYSGHNNDMAITTLFLAKNTWYNP